MQPNEIGRSYDTIAHVWQEPNIQSNGIPQFERAIKFNKARNHALDIGCGSSGRFFDLLLRHGFQVEGIDVSEKMIALARERYPNIPLYHEDVCTWNLPRKYDFISAWDSTWHLPLEKQELVLQKICEGLAPNGVFIFTTGELMNQARNPIPAWGLRCITVFWAYQKHWNFWHNSSAFAGIWNTTSILNNIFTSSRKKCSEPVVSFTPVDFHPGSV